MRNSILFYLFLLPVALMAQVGIGTTTPNESAKLDVSSTSQGFLPPRVTLTGTTDGTTIKNAAGSSIIPATGLFVYNTATAGTSPSNVTPGLYYYDGSKWQRIINQQPDATIEFNQLTPTTASVVFTPNTPSSKDYVYVSTVDASQWTYNGTTYITYTPPASTAWNLAGGTTDAGSNKTGAILRTGNVGVGPTTPPVYPGYTSMAISNATNGGVLDFLNGSNRVGTIYNDANKFIIGTVGATAYSIPLVFITGGSASERMRITGTGNVGIGTTTPSNILEINGSGGAGTGLKLTTGASANKLLSSDASGNASWATNLVVHSVGEIYGGGIVFYVYDNGTHGLIAAPTDQGSLIQWYNSSSVTNAARNGIEAGKFNTERIIINQGSGNYAAQICANQQIGTWGDWYLPSIHELNLLYIQKSAVGGFSTGVYWSSSEVNSSVAWNEEFSTGNQRGYNLKTDSYNVRAIRAF